MAKRVYGTGQLYSKLGAYYGRWRTADGRRLNRKVGEIREPGGSRGLTRPQAERAFRRMQEQEDLNPRPVRTADTPTVQAVSQELRRRLELRGLRKSYRDTCESIERVHIAPCLGDLAITDVDTRDVEGLSLRMLQTESSPKTVRNVLGYLHQVFEYAIKRDYIRENPARYAERPGRSKASDDLQFLSVEELEAVLRAIPDEVVRPKPAPTRRGRRGPAPPPSPDVLGPVLRVVILTAAMTGLRQSELLGLRWRDIDWVAQRIRARKTVVRGEHSDEGKSELSVKRSVPMATRLAGELDRWSKRTEYRADEALVFAHPLSGRPLDRSKVSKRFKQACTDASVTPIRFHDLRHTFATRLAASGTSIRTIQEFMGHADTKTTQIYQHYAPSEQEVELVDKAFAPTASKNAGVQFGVQTEQNSDAPDDQKPSNHAG